MTEWRIYGSFENVQNKYMRNEERPKKILELLQLKGCLEVHEEVKEDKVFEKVNTATQISLYERQAALTDNALEILEAYIPEEKSMLSSLEGKKVISSDDYYEIVNKRNEISGLVNDIIEQKKSIDEKESGKQKCLDEIQALQPWLELDVPMNFQGTKTPDLWWALFQVHIRNRI